MKIFEIRLPRCSIKNICVQISLNFPALDFVGKRNSGNFNKISVVLLPHPDITYVQKTFFQMNYNPLGDHVFKYESNCFATREQLKKVCLESRYCLDGSNIKTAIDEMCLGTAPG